MSTVYFFLRRMRNTFYLSFQELGTPSDKIWPGPPSYSELPAVKKVKNNSLTLSGILE